MKTFKSFIGLLGEEKPNAKPKAKGEADFVATHDVELTDITDQEKEGSAKVVTKKLSAKRKTDRSDNAQAMGESKKTYKDLVKEVDLTKQQTKMAHTIGKEFEKKKVGDPEKGGPYAVATSMVIDRPEAAKKAYATIKSKMKEDADAEILFNLYDSLNEENQKFFLLQLEDDAESLLEFAKNLTEE